jgi:hypothetical protein
VRLELGAGLVQVDLLVAEAQGEAPAANSSERMPSRS